MFIAIVSIIDIVIYVATLAYNGISNIGFLAPTNKAMYMFGSKVRICDKNARILTQ